MKLNIINSALLQDYLQTVGSLQNYFNALTEAELSTNDFSFYTSVASVFSSKIEGETIDLDSYIKHKRFGVEYQPDYTKKIDDLYQAYDFAKKKPINEQNISKIHQILAQNFLPKKNLGKYRINNIYVASKEGKIEYVAAEASIVVSELEKLLSDLQILLVVDLKIEEVFYYASMIHLVFVKIHPWNDGNGRTARLLEKWFLAEKLGEKSWYIQNEKFYYEHHELYYKNIRALGLEYDFLNYDKALDFLIMLPKALKKYSHPEI